jgi:type I restriction enzyme S subunit
MTHALPKLSRVATGSTYEAVSGSDIGNLLVPLPDLPTQKAIATFLDRETARIDQLIEKKQRLVELLGERMARERDGRCASGVSTKLRHIRRYITSGSRGWGQFYADEGDLFVRIGNVSRPGIDLDLTEPAFVSLPSSAEGMRTRLAEGDLLVSITADLGSVAVVDGRASGAFVSQHVALIKLSEKKAHSRYTAHALLATPAQAQFDIAGYGGTKQGLALDDVLDISVPMPSLEQQHQIAAALDEFSGKLNQISGTSDRSIDRLKEYRSALITAAVTGQIDVETWSRRGESDRRLDQIEEEMAG